VLHKYHEEFPTEEASFKKARGDKEIQKRLIKEWSDMADYANNIGSRVHFILEEKGIVVWIEKKLENPSSIVILNKLLFLIIWLRVV
jgi:hypothetical protein